MALEIERRFLVRRELWSPSEAGILLAQGYLAAAPELAVRVRVAGAAAWLTVKGPTRGVTRAEFEYPIPVEDARLLLELCELPPVEKVRRRVPVGRHVFEVDEFLGKNSGLLLAEVELSSEDEEFERPAWLGDEVSTDPRYFSAALAARPFSEW
jgi:adenylate cyclase